MEKRSSIFFKTKTWKSSLFLRSQGLFRRKKESPGLSQMEYAGAIPETAYTVLTNNGPGAGLYFEFLPYTQEIGGYEQLGLFLCQEDPRKAALKLRSIMLDNDEYDWR